MNILSKEKALKLLEKTVRELSNIPDFEQNFSKWAAWARNVVVRTEAIFGSGSKHVQEVAPLVAQVLAQKNSYERKSGSEPILGILESFYSEIQDLWSDEGSGELIQLKNEGGKGEETPVDSQGRDVFVVHGHDHGRMQAIARFLEHLGLNAIILHERASTGSTIVEKLEKYAETAFAIVLLTPDDVGSVVAAKENLRPRARQNVVLELGYFMGRLGRKRTCALVVEDVEIPSDYSGVVYIQIDKGDAWKFHLTKELRAAGLPIDLNKVLE
jgi:hypothetical protein